MNLIQRALYKTRIINYYYYALTEIDIWPQPRWKNVVSFSILGHSIWKYFIRLLIIHFYYFIMFFVIYLLNLFLKCEFHIHYSIFTLKNIYIYIYFTLISTHNKWDTNFTLIWPITYSSHWYRDIFIFYTHKNSKLSLDWWNRESKKN